jgi:hypothetical protein
MAALPRSSFPPAARAPLPSHLISTAHREINSSERLIPFVGIFAKETPTSLVFEPAVLGYLDKSEF